jgi:uncharacterized membrane protein
VTSRRVIALISLIGLFLATYLTLYKLGYIETLACGTGSCEVVQSSKWSTLFGQPVAMWGVGFYLAMLVLSLAGSFGSLEDSRALGFGLALLSGSGVLFSGWLTYVEIGLLHAICRYCVASACLVLVLFALSILDLRRRSEAIS